MPLTDKQRQIAQNKLLTRRIKELTIAFIQMEADKEMQFTNKGNTKDATRLVQSMRVKLSRMRAEVRRRKLNLDNFMMRLKSYEYLEDKDITIITLTKTAPLAEIEHDVAELLKGIKDADQ